MATTDLRLEWDYPKHKDCFMGRENRRHWVVNKSTGKRKRVTEKEFDKAQSRL